MGICGISVPPDVERDGFLTCQLVRRLQPLGIRPRMARNTALVELASELPATMVSRLLGVHQSTADSWKRIGGQYNAYAAGVASRP
ncbi:hypothetical protein KZO11_34510 [Streptomyces anulatus]|nr:hypothetical protein KZO11_34510 [Streptomyces anulatus]